MSRIYRVPSNRWYQMEEDYWMCVGWDVWQEFGVWKVAPYHGKRAWSEHDSAHSAMGWADNHKGD